MIGKELVGKGEVCLCLSEQPGCVTMPCNRLECISVERYCGS